ncbi:hypothetical protein FH972_022892 [Carpinus fangiana]|uniref:O-acyltransferase n=1 Tax=Carpinus fangiana TaxID=176857 RepID=A0A5N6KU28_9ROSI|nr:hypothetical protein FH972_022892 [Carpinus fangiana]
MAEPQLTGRLSASVPDRNGVLAQIDVDKSPRPSLHTASSGTSHSSAVLVDQTNASSSSASPSRSHIAVNGKAQPSEEYEEDYDAQESDDAAMVVDGGSKSTTSAGPTGLRRKSIPVMLEKTDKKGRYILRADDTELREIIRDGIERQSGGSSAPKKGLRDLVFTRRFTTFDGRNPSSSDSPFKGFFVLFWLCMGMMLLRVAAYNWRTFGSVLGRNEVMTMMFSKDVIVLGITDGVMTLATVFGVGLQHVILRGYLSWDRSGWIIQNLWQIFYLAAIIGWTLYREWPWSHTVFVVLHAIVFLMKQHSYAFYNGYLSQVYRRKQLITRKLAQLKDMATSPTASPVDHNSKSDFATLSPEDASSLRQRRHSSQTGPASGTKEPSNLSYDTPEIASAAEAISSGADLTSTQVTAFAQILTYELDILSEELKGKCSVTSNHYPRNLTLFNWAEWTCLPTLVYELEYPRQERINWAYVAEKSAATFGTIFIMMVISQAYIFPPVAETVRMKEAGMSVAERWAEFPWIVSDMLFPLLLEQLLTWYVIWECILNVLAELTRFADRGFYGDWWNSTSWDQYARDWNRPVHNFLLRHVYHSSISALRLSRGSATFVTFLLSACVHELVMLCLFKKLRGYLFAMQLMQLPLVAMSRTKILRGRKIMGNIVFWIGLFVGPSFLTGLYLVV